MDLTVQYLKENFLQLNETYFQGQLPLPLLIVSSSKTLLGQFWSLRNRARLLHAKKEKFIIRISDYYDMPSEEYRNILLHEMIHYYIEYNNIKDTSPHGQKFREMMHTFNTKYGWHVSISSKNSKWKIRQCYAKPFYTVLALTTNDNKHYLSVVNPNYMKYIEKQISLAPSITSHKWFKSENTYFNRFSQSRSLRGRIVSEEVYNQFLSESI